MGVYLKMAEKDAFETVNRIILLLQEHHMTAKQYLEYMGLNRSALTDWKNRKAKPTADTIRKTAELFSVSTDYLMGLTDNALPINADEMPAMYFKLAKQAKEMDLSERDIDFILNVAKSYKLMEKEEE